MDNKIEDQLLSRNIRPTAMRQLILKAIIEKKSAITLADLEIMFDKVDKSTLYRTLKTFKKNKLIHSVDVGGGSIKYALCYESCECEPEDLHVHFLCEKCKQTFCLNDVAVPRLGLPANFELTSVNIIVNGKCNLCK